ncbi:anthranilate phosphoribosyltransferase [Kineococcus xinjiangensis]|uniref:Anthranilate phosphoribosyltransferase n=1 Tax=Kineococcus xinjiangensis TaxID=512762 RepID=A0A2S6IMA7_9ACTN|nr:anthranilate phosphoribosyltransferase [Kineococcus xinjiangensis]PPK95295.1 anthranilate phosphoribosyltransferase [Kineococcus xinjiangensis]
MTSSAQPPAPATPGAGRRTWTDLIARLVAGEDLDAASTSWAMDQVMAGEANEVQLAGFLVALRAKGETVAELEGLAAAMLDHAVPITVPGPAVDLVGTGGDGARTVNISTMAALVLAGAGHRVVKHGNRAASSASGSADVLEALGVRLDLPPARVAEVAVEAGITFCFAQVFHPAMRHAAPTRRALGIPTAFNVLGPLTNPARPQAAAIGVAFAAMAPLVAGVLARRDVSALVFRGDDGLDELTTVSPARVWSATPGGGVREGRLDAVAELGMAPAVLEDLRGDDATHNAAVARRLLDGTRGPVRDAVVLNAAAAMLAAGVRAPGAGGQEVLDDLPAHLAEGVRRAEESLDSGAAAGVLERWVEASAG